jgi:hypothetical protein
MGFMTGQRIYHNFTNRTGSQDMSGSTAMMRRLAEEYLGPPSAPTARPSINVV